MDQTADPASSSGTPANPSSPPPSTCGSGSSVGVGGGESMLVPVVLDDLTFDNRQVRHQTRDRPIFTAIAPLSRIIYSINERWARRADPGLLAVRPRLT